MINTSNGKFIKIGSKYFQVINSDFTIDPTNKSKLQIYSEPSSDEMSVYAYADGRISAIFTRMISDQAAIAKDNKTKAYEMLDYIKDSKITDIESLDDSYVFEVCYILSYEDGKIEGPFVYMDKADVIDCIFVNDVADDNSINYTYGKMLSSKNTVSINSEYPLGIMSEPNKPLSVNIMYVKVYENKLNVTSIYDMNKIHQDITQQSLINTIFKAPSASLSDYMENKQMIFPQNSDIKYSPVTINGIIKKIEFNFKLVMTDYTIFKTTDVIKTLLQYNGQSIDITEKPGDETGDSMVWVHCEATDEGAKLIVADDYPIIQYNTSTMIREYMVLGDIPSAKIGDYAKFILSEITV